MKKWRKDNQNMKFRFRGIGQSCHLRTILAKKNTQQIIQKQIKLGLNKIKSKNNIIIAYEPVWSIGTGLIPKQSDLLETINFIKKTTRGLKVLYGGSVNPKNINELKTINNIDGFLIGGASQDPKKFIDIIKKTYT